jgi:hypothetical protein
MQNLLFSCFLKQFISFFMILIRFTVKTVLKDDESLELQKMKPLSIPTSIATLLISVGFIHTN